MYTEATAPITAPERTSTRRTWPRKIAAAAAVAALAACSGPSKGESNGTAASTPNTSSTSASPRPGTKIPTTHPTVAKQGCELKGAGRSAALRTEKGSVHLSHLVVKALRTGNHTTGGSCYERVTLPLQNGALPDVTLPGVRAEYVTPPIRLDPSDKIAHVDGNAVLKLIIGSWTYTQGGGEGPTDIRPTNVDHIDEILLTQNEGISNVFIGLDAKHDFTLRDATGPQCPTGCIVLDIEIPQK
jgi:hypothetical protein